MKVLFDQNVPVDLAPYLKGHKVSTARRMGWSELENGDLLNAAEAAGFALFVTCDGNIRYQQQLTGRSLAIVEITQNHWRSIEPHTLKVAEAVDTAAPGSYQIVECKYVYNARGSSADPNL